MPKGTGFARRVTLANLESFAPLLGKPQQRPMPTQGQTGADDEIDLDEANTASPPDPALKAAEALFHGQRLDTHNQHRRAARSARARVSQSAGPRASVGTVSGASSSSTLPVLVAEIPKAAGRWKQANFDLATWTGFFGAREGSQRTIKLRHVEADGTLGPLETRRSVAVKSRNFRFELDAAGGIPYPIQGRPIVVFLRLESGDFLYRLVLPHYGDEHARLDKFLTNRWYGRNDRMRRIRATVEDLSNHLPDSPLWTAAGRVA
jgi:hypothetical protein